MNYAESKTPFAFSVILYLSIRLKRERGKLKNKLVLKSVMIIQK